jgi:tRNA threonylcarbamoyladenosine biosynthesis protein TsaE
MKVSLTDPTTIEIQADSLSATAAIAASLAKQAMSGDVIALKGDLGTGKTAFARAFIQARAGQPVEVPSPTFTLVQTYELANGAIWHFDLYRLKSSSDVYELGLDEALGGITLIEWPERLAQDMPRNPLQVTLAPGPTAESRRLTLTGNSVWADRLADLKTVLSAL